jgi:hypothetical protein
MYRVRLRPPPRIVTHRNAFPIRPPTPAERDIQTLKEINFASHLFAESLSTFAVIYYSLSWITYRRMNQEKDQKKKNIRNKKE